MEKKEYLTEENYLKGKKKLVKIALIIFVTGLLIGGGFITAGIVKTNEAKKTNEEIESTPGVVSRTEAEVQNDIDATKTKIDGLTTEITSLQREKSQIFREEGFSDRYYAKEDEATLKQKEKADLQIQLSQYKTELWKIQSGYNDTKNEIFQNANKISTSDYVFLFIIGGFIIISSSMIAGSLYLISKQREITAFTAQQIMPIAQEGMEKMAPTVGKVGKTIAQEMAPAYGEIAKEISKGIKKGKMEAEKEK